MECYKHPEAAAVASCVICQEPVCEFCRTWHAGYATCHMCAAREQLRQARAAMSAAETPKGEAGSPAPPLPATGFAAGARGFFLAGLAALAGAFLWSRVALWTGGSLGVLAVALGWGVGAAVRSGAAGRPGSLLPCLALLLSAFGVMLGFGLIQMGHAFRLHPELAREAAGIPLPLQALLFTAAVPTKLGLLEWLCAYLALFAAWRASRQHGAASTDVPALAEVPGREPAAVLATVGESHPTANGGPHSFPGAPPPMGPASEGEREP